MLSVSYGTTYLPTDGQWLIETASQFCLLINEVQNDAKLYMYLFLDETISNSITLSPLAQTNLGQEHWNHVQYWMSQIDVQVAYNSTRELHWMCNCQGICSNCKIVLQCTPFIYKKVNEVGNIQRQVCHIKRKLI